MREELLYYLWQHRKFSSSGLVTTAGEPLVVLSPGMHNREAGPDFFNSRAVIGTQEWAGNVEIHINSSDWYWHGHEKDLHYDNVILHVVWNHDVDVFRKDNSPIPVLELRRFISDRTLADYEKLLEKRVGKWINCENEFSNFGDFLMEGWLERLFLERLEAKTEKTFQMLKRSSNNWEEVLFLMLAKNFGLNLNGEAFLSMAQSIPFSVVQKVRKRGDALEALFLGQAGLLQKTVEEPYFLKLQREYLVIKQKFGLSPAPIPVAFFRLRPDNFPNIRLAQLAALYHKREALFSEVARATSREELYTLFELALSEFWETHYTFLKGHTRKKKRLSKRFIDLLIINTLVPIKYCLARYEGREVDEELLLLISSIKAESNSTVGRFNKLRPDTARNALQSQALLQLKQGYCDLNQCLNCRLGVKLLEGEV